MADLEKIISINPEKFDEEISSGLVLVNFYADWCGDCRAFDPLYMEFAVKYNKFQFKKINVSGADNQKIKYRIMEIPTIILFKDGYEINRIVGYYSKILMRYMLRNVIGEKEDQYHLSLDEQKMG